MLILKKILTALVMPASLSVVMLLAGLCLLLLTRRKRAGKVLLAAGAVFLTVMSCNVVARSLLMLFEYHHPALSAQRLAEWLEGRPPGRTPWIVVLGGGHTDDPSLSATAQTEPIGLVRLTEGIALYRRVRGSRLLLSGGTTFDGQTDADLMADVARSLGVPARDMVIENDSHDTADQARILRETLGDKEFILVTSAAHMTRSMALFRKQGMRPIPAPTAHRTHRGGGVDVFDFLPTAEGLSNSTKVFYEAIGLLWAKMRGTA